MAWEELDCTKPWPPGQPVTLETEGIRHLCWVRLTGVSFRERWLAPLSTMVERRVHPRELSARDPRAVWSDPFELQLAAALLAAERDERCAWVAGPFDADQEPELWELHLQALEELAWRPATTPPAGPAPAPQPRVQRAWTRSERDAMRHLADEAIAPVNLAPGR